MQDDLKNILSATGGKSSGQELLKYLNGELSNADMNRLEQGMVDDAFESDALDGLQEVENKERIALIVDGLNRDLKKRTVKKAKGREKNSLKPQWWLYFSVLILLFILVLVYLFLHSRVNA